MFPIGDDDSSRRTVPLVTYALIALNVLFFIVELTGGDAFIMKWAFVPKRFLANPASDFLTLFSSMFMHAGWLHLGGNMLYLWIFGDNVEDRFGHLKFIIFYVICGLAATFAQLAFSIGSDIPNLGASGAIAGVLGRLYSAFPAGKSQSITGSTGDPGVCADSHRTLDRPTVIQRNRLHCRSCPDRWSCLHGAYWRICSRGFDDLFAAWEQPGTVERLKQHVVTMLS